jgi:hypothetical protein
MTSWQEFTDEVPEFAARIEARLRAHTNLTMATIRADGGPRISGNEIRIRDGQLLLGGMPNARRWNDLRRDPRIGIHSGSDPVDMENPATWPGDAKVHGLAREITDPDELAAFMDQENEMPPGTPALFRIEPTHVSWIGLPPPGDKLVVETWKPGQELVRVEY